MFKFVLDVKSGVPFHRQIIDQIRYGIASEKLLPGEQLPTVRELSVSLQINPNTVRKAYTQLEILGILHTQQGTGTFVGQQEVQIDECEKQQKLKQICDEIVARGQQYGFGPQDIVDYLHRRLTDGE